MQRGYRYNAQQLADFRYEQQLANFYSRNPQLANFGVPGMGMVDNAAQWMGKKILNPAQEFLSNRGARLGSQADELTGQVNDSASSLKRANKEIKVGNDGMLNINQDKFATELERAKNNEKRLAQVQERQGQLNRQVGDINSQRGQANRMRDAADRNDSWGQTLGGKNAQRIAAGGAVGATGLAGLAGANALRNRNQQQQRGY